MGTEISSPEFDDHLHAIRLFNYEYLNPGEWEPVPLEIVEEELSFIKWLEE